jgi:nicotinamide riboside kinase
MAEVIAIVGAESTGKTTLARALATRLAADTGLACAWVGEALRDWCDAAGRTPRPDEQAAIADAQWQRIEAAAVGHDIVVADTTPLSTAVYSLLLFGDGSLVAAAAERQRRCSATLLTALDIDWVADGLQRDGPHVRAPVDDLLRRLMGEHGIAWSVVSGRGEARLAQALAAVAPQLAQAGGTVGLSTGLFTGLVRRPPDTAAWVWVCDTCDVPDCEHASRRAAARG